MKIAFYTLGCKVNQYDSQALLELLEKNGHEIVPPSEQAQVYVVNSCTVTASADSKTRQAVRRFKRERPQSVVVLMGCMAQTLGEDCGALPEADIILGNREQKRLLEIIESYNAGSGQVISVLPHTADEGFEISRITRLDGHTRAFIKIEDGCDRFCSYCIIPYARGRVRSKPISELKSEVAAVCENGCREVVLTGINLSSYGRDLGLNLADAVRAAQENEKIARVRLGSLEPDHMTDELLDELSRCEKLCPQFHISLQSGCTKTLTRMNRHYTAEQYAELCRKLRERFDGCTLTTDIMVGFAGESEEDFNQSLRFAEKMRFEKIHVFPYSVRRSTKAQKFEAQVSKQEKNRRCELMLELAGRLRQEFLESQKGKTTSVLVESEGSDGLFGGYTENYTPVKIISPGAAPGEIVRVEIIGVQGDFCLAKALL